MIDIPKRNEGRPPRPPVPKFRMVGAGTDTPDFLPPPKSESSLNALSLDNTSETSSEEICDSFFNRKRTQAITDEIVHHLALFQLGENIQKIAIQFLKPKLLESLKKKKYNAIAVALIIAATKKLSLPITLKELLSKTNVSEKQIKKILLKIPMTNVDVTIEAFIKQICSQLQLNQNVQNVCLLILGTVERCGVIQGEHENVIAATIVRVASELIFRQQGGINPQIIADAAKCCLYSVRQFIKKLSTIQQIIVSDLMVKCTDPTSKNQE